MINSVGSSVPLSESSYTGLLIKGTFPESQLLNKAYKTAVNITGSGYLKQFVMNGGYNAGKPCLRITVDGQYVLILEPTSAKQHTAFGTMDRVTKYDSSSYFMVIPPFDPTFAALAVVLDRTSLYGDNPTIPNAASVCIGDRPIFFSQSLLIEVARNDSTATSNTAYWVFSGGAK